jgi:hypothetical protein
VPVRHAQCLLPTFTNWQDRNPLTAPPAGAQRRALALTQRAAPHSPEFSGGEVQAHIDSLPK